jgi:hypothetical protein
VAIECARLGAAAIAIDRDADATAIAQRNAAAHGVPLQAGARARRRAPWPPPDPMPCSSAAAGADLDAILDLCCARARRAVVVTLAIVERAGPALQRLQAGDSKPRRQCCRPAGCARWPAAPARRREPSRSCMSGGTAMTGLVVARLQPRLPGQELLELIGAVARRGRRAAGRGAARSATVDRRADEPGMVAAARHHGWPLVTHTAPRAARRRGADAVGRRRRARRHAERRGGGGAAERRGSAAVPKRRSARATCALAEAT